MERCARQQTQGVQVVLSRCDLQSLAASKGVMQIHETCLRLSGASISEHSGPLPM